MKLELPKKQKMPKKKENNIYCTNMYMCISNISSNRNTNTRKWCSRQYIWIKQNNKKNRRRGSSVKSKLWTLLDNTLLDKGNYTVQKNNQDKEIIYTEYSKQEKKDNHELDVNLPYINIKNEEVKQIQ